MNKRSFAVLLAVLFFGVMYLPAQSAVGTIRYLEGEVTITRGSGQVESEEVSIGTIVDEFDTLQTGPDGYAEVELDAPSAGSLVRVKGDTSFYFEGTPRNSNWFRTTFQLLRGSLSLKVGRLSRNESFQVQTDNAVMAVRGTEFNVDVTPDRSVLLTVPEGQVEGSAGNSRVSAEPGRIAVINAGSPARELSVGPEDVELYRQYWQGLRQDALRINARLSIQQYSRQWDRDLARLESAMRELQSHEEIFRKWNEIGINRNRDDWPSTGEAIRDKREISRGMLELRGSLPLAERSFETLVGLEEAWKAGYARGNFTAGAYRNADDFYRSFNRDKRKMRLMLAAARRMIRIYRFIDRVSGQSFESGGMGLMDTTPSL